MKTVPINDLKRNLSELVDEASRGERILITRHNRPVATLVGAGSTALHTGSRFGAARLQAVVLHSTRSIAQTLADDRSEDR